VKRFGFGVGLALVLVALATAVAQLFSLLAHGGYVPIALAAIWAGLHADSLEHVRALAEQEVAPLVRQAPRWLLSLPALAGHRCSRRPAAVRLPPRPAPRLALPLQRMLEVNLTRHGLTAWSPDGPGDDERRLDAALG
jgi:hypothetical protein